MRRSSKHTGILKPANSIFDPPEISQQQFNRSNSDIRAKAHPDQLLPPPESASEEDDSEETPSEDEEEKLRAIDMLKEIGLVGNDMLNQLRNGFEANSDLRGLFKEFQKTYEEQYQSRVSVEKQRLYITVREVTEIQQIELRPENSLQEKLAKCTLSLIKKISHFCNIVVSHYIFEFLTLSVIVLNSIVMACSDPTETKPTQIQDTFEKFFLSFYLLQMTLKICGKGLVFNENAYLRNPWNIMDAVIVVSSILPYFITVGFSVNSLRAIRVLRPLRTITKIKALKRIVKTLFDSFSLVFDSFILLIITITIFSIVGLTLFRGSLKNNCLDTSTGIMTSRLCVSDDSCADNFKSNKYVCARGISSPNFSTTNFDTFFWSVLNVFQILSLEGWSTTMIQLENAYGIISYFFCISIVFVCEMIILNITLAILKYKFSEVKQKRNLPPEPEVNPINIPILKKLKLYDTISNLGKNEVVKRYQYPDKGAYWGMPSQHTQQRYSTTIVRKKTILKTRKSKSNKKESIRLPDEASDLPQQLLSKKSVRIMPVPSSKHIVSGRSIQSILNIPSKVEIEVSQPPFQINQILYNPLAPQQKNALQKEQEINQIMQSDSQIFSEDDMSVDTKLILQSKRTVDLNNIIAIQKNKFLFSLIQSLVTSNRDIILPESKGIQLQLPNFEQKPNEGLFEGLDYNHHFKKENFLKEQREFVKKMTYLASKKNIMRHQTIKEVQAEQNIDIEDIKIMNEINKKHLVLQLVYVTKNQEEAEKEASLAYEYRVERILQNERPTDAKKSTLCAKNNHHTIHYRHETPFSAEKEFDKILKVPEYQLSMEMEVLAQSNRVAPETPAQKINRSFKKSKTRKPKNQFAQFKIRFNQSSGRPKTSTDLRHMQTEKQLQKECFPDDQNIQAYTKKLNKKMTFIRRKVSSKNSNTLQGSTHKWTRYENIVLDPSNEHNHEIYERLEKQYFANENSIVMNCPTDEIILQKGNLSQYLHIKPEAYNIWIPGVQGCLEIVRNRIRIILSSPFYDNLILLLVVMNTILLGLNGIINQDDSSVSELIMLFNKIFTGSFAIDIILKLLAYDLDFFEDFLNVFDLIVVIISIVEISVTNRSTGSNFSAFRTVRIFRAFRVLRVTRLIRSLKFMSIISAIIVNILAQFFYIFLLLALFTFIYVLLGMQIFGGTTLPQSITGVRQNFDTFFNALFSVFQVLTVENWNDVALVALTSSASQYSVIYLVSWILIGNWVLLNLLQAVLLDGFDIEQVTASKLIQNDQLEDHETTPEEEQKEASRTFTMMSMTDNRLSTKKPTNHMFRNKSTNISAVHVFQDNYNLGLFGPQSQIRIICSAICHSIIFELIVYAFIFVSCSKLVYDTYIIDQSQEGASISDLINNILNSFFLVEFLIKIISYGFINYLGSNWNKLDFIIVASGILDYLLDANLSVLKIFRALRPLRLVAKNLRMKIIISSLMESVSGLANVSLVIIMVFLMFGILGINLLQGKLYYCDTGVGQVYGPYNLNQQSCLAQGYFWKLHSVNFQNIYQSLLSLYIFATRENWTYIYYTFVDADDSGPIKDNNPMLYFIITVVFIFICSYFLMDLFVGVLFMNFHISESRLNPKKLTPQQNNWVELQKLILNTDPHLQLFIEPSNYYRKKVFQLLSHPYYQNAMAVLIVCNVLVMASLQDDSPITEEVVRWFNNVFTVIFLVELIFKLIAFGIRGYFLLLENILDFIVIIVCFLDFFDLNPVLRFLPLVGKIFRVLRLIRMLRKFKNIQKLLETVISILPPAANIVALLSLYLFIAAVIASFTFGDINQSSSLILNEEHNFSNFHRSVLLLFQCMTGQNWYMYMFATMDTSAECAANSSCGNPVYIVFWLPFIFIGQKVMFELFVLVVLDQFEETYIKQNNPIGIHQMLSEDFTKTWISINKPPNSIVMEPKHLVELVLQMKPPIGFGQKEALQTLTLELGESKLSEEDVKLKIFSYTSKLRQAAMRYILKMQLPNQPLTFHSIFYKFAKKGLTSDDVRNPEQERLLRDVERDTEQKLMERDANFSDICSDQEVNPLVAHIFTQIALKAWEKYSRKKNQEPRADDSLEQSDVSDNDEVVIFEEVLEKHKFRDRRNKISRISKVTLKDVNVPNTENYAKDNFFD